MPALCIPAEEEIRAATRQGQEAVVALIGEMIQAIALLAQKVQGLEDKLEKEACKVTDPAPVEVEHGHQAVWLLVKGLV